jgi:hypothetical protein
MMKRKIVKNEKPQTLPADLFDVVRREGLALPGVQAALRYDGSPMLKLGGCFMAGLATHPSAERGTLVVRMDLDERAALVDDAPETYYLTDYYRTHPVVLARLSRLDRDALHDLLTVSWRLTLPKTKLRIKSDGTFGTRTAPRS